MECACIENDFDGPYVEILTDKIRRARKCHTCNECRREISPGEHYRYESYADDGRVDHHKTCADCNSIRIEMFCGSFCYGDILSEVREYVSDANGDIPEDCLVALTPNARGRICEMIEEVWEGLHGK